MVKEMGVLVGGIFVGAVCVEIIRKTRPEVLDGLYAKVGGLTSATKEAFMEGYHGALNPKEPEPTEA